MLTLISSALSINSSSFRKYSDIVSWDSSDHKTDQSLSVWLCKICSNLLILIKSVETALTRNIILFCLPGQCWCCQSWLVLQLDQRCLDLAVSQFCVHSLLLLHMSCCSMAATRTTSWAKCLCLCLVNSKQLLTNHSKIAIEADKMSRMSCIKCNCSRTSLDSSAIS